MHVLDHIIQNREAILAIANRYGASTLKLYGSVLVRKEHSESDIDFLVVFDTSTLEDEELICDQCKVQFNLGRELADYFGRRVSVFDSRRIPDLFYPSIRTDPVDIRELSADKLYTRTPKTSKLYFRMLHRLFREFTRTRIKHKASLRLFASRLSWWLSRLLRFEDNNLREYEGFDFTEVLYLCDKLSSITDGDYTRRDADRLRELYPKIKEFVQLDPGS